jgi:ABC-type glycerol-3-phosphate transport system substrate-binding protein
MKKLPIIATAGCLALSLALCGCGGQASSSSTSSTTQAASTQAQPTTAALDTPIKASTKNGDLEISVEGFVNSPKMREQFATSDKIADNKTVGVLELVVNNVSYQQKNSSLPDYIPLDDAMYATDSKGISMDPMNSAIDYGEYAAAAGAYFKCPQGQTKRAAVLYVVDKDLAQVTVHVGNTTVAVPVTQEQ